MSDDPKDLADKIEPGSPIPPEVADTLQRLRFGDRLKALRRGAGISQDELQSALGAGSEKSITVSRWERGVHEPDGEYLVRLVQIFSRIYPHFRPADLVGPLKLYDGLDPVDVEPVEEVDGE